MSDSDDDIPIGLLSKKPAASNGSKSAPKVVKKEEADSDDDDVPISQLATSKRKRDDDSTSKASAAAKKKKAKNPPASKKEKPKAKPKPKPKTKKKRAESSDEEEEEEDVDEEDEDLMDESEEGDEEEGEDDEESDFMDKDSDDEAPNKKSKGKAKASSSAKKNPAAKKKKTSATKKKANSSKASKGSKKKAAVKKEDKKDAAPKAALSSKAVRIEQAMKAFKWWDEAPLPAAIQWLELEHNGIFFPPEYVPHGVKMRYDGQEIELPPLIEEVATFFASIPPDGPQLGNDETAGIFTKNFFDQFRKMLTDKLDSDLGIKDFSKCDFEPIRAHLEQQKMIKKAATNEEKSHAKAEKEQKQDFYGYAIVDGRIEKVGNYNMEPPGLFRGRGKHPLMGKIKKRCMPESITINIGPDARVPPCPVPGHAWDRVQHDNKVTWLASWKENVLNSVKYVMLSASSSFKGKSDLEKYDKAARLKLYIDKIRRDYEGSLTKKGEVQQLATAMWIIDKLALRVGGEKGDDEADTVGCCSLRKEHLTFAKEEGVYEIELEFLGKDSMLFKQTIDFSTYGENGIQVFKNLRSFVEKKKPSQDVFDALNPSTLNAHLSNLMPGLTAKVFRTYNASETLQNELPKTEDLEGMSMGDKVLAYNEANRKVAILCNHQRTVTKGMETALENLQEKLTMLKEQKRELQQQKDLLKQGKTKQIRTRQDDVLTEKAAKAITQAEELKKKAKTPEEKVAASKALDAAKEMKRDAQAAKAKDAHLFAKTPTKEQLVRQIEKWLEKIKKLEVDIRNKDDNKEVALGTSKINYMDPRISVAWCKVNEVPIEKIFAKTLRDKFVWSMGVPPDWRFEGKEKPKA